MKAIAISDVHLGQTGKDYTGYFSLLSPNCAYPMAEEKIEQLAEVMDKFFDTDPITLIGVGDILDLSFSYIRDAFDDFAKLLERLGVDKFIYVIGNHDHHIWTMECEYRNVILPIIKGNQPKNGTVYKDIKENFSILLENYLVSHIGYKPTVTISYPTFQISDMTFSHGHLFGGLYTYMSDILAPFIESKKSYYEKIAATVNMPLIEFIYWLLGETGEGMGAEGVMEAVYADMQKGKKSGIYKAVDSAVDVLLPNGLITGIPDSWERKVIKWVARRIIDHYVKEPKPLSSLDRHSPSEESRRRAQKWMERTEDNSSILVCGHTHIADEYDMSEHLQVINLGTWLVEPSVPDPDTNVLFIDGKNLELRKI